MSPLRGYFRSVQNKPGNTPQTAAQIQERQATMPKTIQQLFDLSTRVAIVTGGSRGLGL